VAELKAREAAAEAAEAQPVDLLQVAADAAAAARAAGGGEL
jgi:hypothetical protein